MKYKVFATVTVYVETWFEDDGVLDLEDQAHDQVRATLSVLVDDDDVAEVGDITLEPLVAIED